MSIRAALSVRSFELVKIRASQINGCAFCLVMHTDEARHHGENDERMHLLNAWREAPVFTERERAALAWVEAVTLVAEDHVPDDVYQQVRGYFSEKELVDLTRLRRLRSTPGTGSPSRFGATPPLKVAKIAA